VNRLFAFFKVGMVMLASLTVLSACGGKTPRNDEGSSTKFHVYYVQGQKLYKEHCSNCHHADGAGLGLVYPPLNKSDFMDKNFEETICLMKNGRKGEILVNGDSYIQGMPPIPTLTNIEIAEIATYIYNSWGHKRGMVDVTDADRILEKCGTAPEKGTSPTSK
jgi:cytochrome c553